MTVPTYDHRDLHHRGRDHYTPPSFAGYPEERDEVTVVYRSKRTGDLTEQTGTVVDVDDMGSYGGSTTHPSYLEIEVDVPGRERNLHVWGGGGYGPDDAETEGMAPAQVCTRGLVSKPNGGRTWRTNGLGRLVRLSAEGGATFEVTVRNVPSDSLESIPDRIEKAIYKRFQNDRNAQDLLDVEVREVDR